MGEVYRAVDTQLQREVAIKLLPPHFADNSDRLRRFQQEARAAAALSHPNILSIYDFGRHEGRPYIVSELLEGHTLRDELRQSQLPPRTAIEYARQIADGLAAAHDKGIIHRDLKPENIFITQDGQAKILDFGLAKLTGADGRSSALLTTEGTTPGMIVGTLGYMSPEQLRAEPVDHRSDIFALGVILCEMLSSHRPFQATTAADTMRSILTGDPNILTVTNREIPSALEQIVRHCLEKQPQRRFQSARDVAFALETQSELSQTSHGWKRRGISISDLTGIRSHPVVLTTIAIGGCAVAVAIIGTLVVTSRPRTRAPQPEPPLRVIPLATLSGIQRHPSLSPDGSQAVFSWNGPTQDNFDIYAKAIGPGPPLRLTTNPAEDLSPVWSPDGASIAFLRALGGDRFSVVLMPALGGAERKLLEVSVQTQWLGGPYISWLPDSQGLVVCDRPSASAPGALFLISLRTAERRQLTFPPTNSLGDGCAAVAADGSAIAFCRRAGFGAFGSEVYIVPLSADRMPSADPVRQLTSEGPNAVGLSWLWDSKRLVVTTTAPGDPSGWLVNVSQVPNGPSRMPVKLEFGERVSWPAAATRSNRVAFARTSSGGIEIWKLAVSPVGQTASAPVRVLASAASQFGQQYSPNGKLVAFESNRSGNLEIWTCNIDGASCAQITFWGPPLPACRRGLPMGG